MRRHAIALVALLLPAACKREERQPQPLSSEVPAVDMVPLSPLRPGPPVFDPSPLPSAGPIAAVGRSAGESAWATSEGQRLYGWYNCSGCHAHGGGGMGPPLMDGAWLYGSRPEDVFRTIVQGRPNGMPSFRGRIPEFQVWQIVAYVRSLSGLLRRDVEPSRSDSMAATEPPSMRPRQPPRPARRPP